MRTHNPFVLIGIDTMKVTKELLLQSGYKKYPGDQINRSDALYQKRIVDDKGRTKYFINVWMYDWTKFHLDYLESCAFAFKVQFTKLNGDNFNVEDLSDSTIEEHESFFENVWNNVKGVGYYGD